MKTFSDPDQESPRRGGSLWLKENSRVSIFYLCCIDLIVICKKKKKKKKTEWTFAERVHFKPEHCKIWIVKTKVSITLNPRLPFPNSVGSRRYLLGRVIFSPGPATTQKIYQGSEWFFQLAGLQWMTVLSTLIRGITAGDWHILLSCYVTLFWLRVIRQVSVLWMWGLTKLMTQLLNTTVT